jgi:alpha-glucosidase
MYTIAEEASRTGMPMLRPLFLEFPKAFQDGHPIDTDTNASGEFLLGGDLLIAPPPYPDETDSYSVEFPSTDWFDFWTGGKIEVPNSSSMSDPDPPVIPGPKVPLSIGVTPELTQLPVYVRAGSILPMAPLTQSTNETPKGALTLRVYAGDGCAGELYQDDGKTYEFQHGMYLRAKFSCQVDSEGLHLKIGPHEGSYPAWWKEIRVEIYGVTPKQSELLVNSKRIAQGIEVIRNGAEFVIPDDGKGAEIELR